MKEILEAVIVLIGTIVIISLVLALPVMWLWNWLMPMIFGLMELNFWQALGISLLSGLLFKSGNSKNN